MAFEDPDLVGLRLREEYVRFRARNYPSPSGILPMPSSTRVLQLSAYVTDLLRTLAATMHTQWVAYASSQRIGGDGPDLATWLAVDSHSWHVVSDLAQDYRDWRVRLDALEWLQQLNAHANQPLPRPLPYPRAPGNR